LTPSLQNISKSKHVDSLSPVQTELVEKIKMSKQAVLKSKTPGKINKTGKHKKTNVPITFYNALILPLN